MYPFPIPDLFCGNPLVVSGRFHGSFPESITLSGLLPDQSTWQTEVPSKRTLTVPLSKVSIISIQVVRGFSYDKNGMRFIFAGSVINLQNFSS